MKAGMTMSFSQSASSVAPRVLTVFSAHACGEYLPWSCYCLWGILILDLLLLLENTYLGAAVVIGEYLPWTCCCYWRILTLDLLLLLENTCLGPAVVIGEYLPCTCCCL